MSFRLVSGCRSGSRILGQLASSSGFISCPKPLVPVAYIHSSVPVFKVRKAEKNRKTTNNALHSASQAASENVFVSGALKEMNSVEAILGDELAKHFSLKVDLRLYEDIIVKMEDGKEHKMSHLARVSMKSPQMIMINFADNPSAIKNAKLALQKSMLNVNPQHEGVVLYVPTPRMTRERREQLANDAKGKMLNEYKAALNEIYVQFDKKSSRESKTPDEEKQTRAKLLDLKRAMEARGVQIIETKRKDLLKEIA